jgi:serine/threonine protein kinase
MNSGSPPTTAPSDPTCQTQAPQGTLSDPVAKEDPERTRAGNTGGTVGLSSSILPTGAESVIGHYSVVRKIGQGGMGAVYLAEDPKLGRKVALKTMKAELAANPLHRERFEREARAAAAVEHENIVPIWSIGEAADGTPFIAMPFLQGEMLADRLKRHPVSGLGLLLKVTREVADGLAAAHARGLIHRDIKPGNIWLEGDLSARNYNDQVRRCKILDFGLARMAGPEDTQLTTTGVVMGTPAFMAPEQALGEQVDHRTDLFSLGVTLYRMATGQMPFHGATSMAVMIALTTETHAPISSLNPNLHPALTALIDRLLSKNPDKRPQSATEVAAAARQIAKDIQNRNSARVPAPPPRQTLVETPGPVETPEPRWEVVTDSAHGPGARPEHPSRKAPILSAEVVSEPDADATEPTRRTGARRAKRRNAAGWSPLRWVIAGACALFALIALGVVVLRFGTGEGELVVEIDDPNVEARIKNGRLVVVGPDGKDQYTLSPSEHNKKLAPGPYTIRVEGADGLVLDTPEFTLKKGDKVVVRVTLAPKARTIEPPLVPPSPNPALAPVVDPEVDRKAAEYILSVGGQIRINEPGKEINSVKDLPAERFRLTTVDLFGNKKATDEGLKVFAGCAHVTVLNLAETRLSEACLVHFKGCRGLQFFAIGSGDRSLKFGDKGLGQLDECKDLRVLWIGGTQVTEKGLATLKSKKRLHDFRFSNTSLDDAGLALLKDCQELTYLWIPDTSVTAKGVADLAKALPRCEIHWAGGKVGPTKK